MSLPSIVPGGYGEGRGGILRSFIRHPNAANLLMALLVLFGLVSAARINTQYFPPVERPTISVSISWPGASAEDVEENVLAIVEPEVRFVDGVDEVRSYAREGSGTVSLEFEDGTDMQEALATVDATVKAISTLPEDAETPNVNRRQWFDNVAKIALTGDVPERTLRYWAKRFRDDLTSRGIAKVEFTGLRDPEIGVSVPEWQLRRLDLTLADISSLIEANSRDLPSGTVDGETSRQIRSLADASTVRSLQQIEVRSEPSGEKVLLGDIATIERGYDDDDDIGLSGGNRAIEIEVERAPTADTLRTAAILSDYLEEIAPVLPRNLQVLTYEVAADSLSDRIGLLVENGIGGLVLVLVVLFIFLEFRIALWVAAGIPVALLTTIGLMYVSGQSINMISLFGLIMMLGVIVDDAIVVGEHTDTRLGLGDGPFEAAENGVGQMIWPVIAAMSTTMASFAPILLIGDTIGQIMGVLPLVVIAVVIASLVECLFILPGHLAHSLSGRSDDRPNLSWWRLIVMGSIVALGLLTALTTFGADGIIFGLPVGEFLPNDYARAGFVALVALTMTFLVEWAWLGLRRRGWRKSQTTGKTPNAFRRGFDAGFGWFRDGPFRAAVVAAYRFRYATVAFAISLLLVGVVGLIRSGEVSFVFFPSAEAENIRGYVTMLPGTPEEETIETIARIDAALRQVEAELGDGEPLVEAVFTTLGSSGRATGDNLAEMRIQLTTSENRTVRTNSISRAWQDAVPQIASMRRFSVVEQRGGPPGRDIEVELSGPSAGDLKAAALETAEILSGIDGVTGVSDDLPYGKPELVLELTPRGSALGFSADAVGRQVRNAFEGTVPRRFADGDEEVAIRLTQEMRLDGAAGLRNLDLRSPDGGFVPLTEVVTITERQGFAAIQRRNGRTIIAVNGDIDPALSNTDEAIAQLQAGGGLDAIAGRYGVEYRFTGRAEEQQEAFSDLTIGTYAALGTIYIILAWIFGSYFRPIAVMLIIPFGLVGAVVGHWLLGFPLTILSLIGLLGLSGILVNDSIILVDRLGERQREGDDLQTAAIGASQDRLRAVLLTSLTTIGGLMPLMYEKSLQAQFLLPMAITIVFGLATATLLVLFLVPALIGIGADISWLLSSIFGSRSRPSTRRAVVPAE